jgi:hypothetical protein
MEHTQSVEGHLTKWHPIRTARALDAGGILAMETGVHGPQADAQTHPVRQLSAFRSVASVHQASGAQ